MSGSSVKAEMLLGAWWGFNLKFNFYGRGILVVQQPPKLPYEGAIPSVRPNFKHELKNRK